jgi:putative ABC transport system permease protein
MMNRPRWHKILADLWGNKARSLLVTASITVGLFAIGVIATQNFVLSDDMRTGYAAANPANIQMSLSSFDQDLVDHIEKLDGVREAEGLRIISTRLESSAALLPGEYVTIELNAFSDLEDKQIDKVRLVEGRWPPGDREIAIEQYKLDETKAQVGDFVTIELPSKKTRQLRLVGVVADQTVGALSVGPGFFLAPAQGYITLNTLEWLEQPLPNTFDTLRITVEGDAGDEEHIQQVSDQVRHEIERIGYGVVNTAKRSSFDHPNRRFIDALGGVLFLVGLFVVFLSGFLITNTLQAIINQQIVQIGILKTLGSRRRQIIILYTTLIFIFGVLATAIAVPLAYQVSFQRIQPLARTINSAFQGARIVPGAIAMQVAIALVVPQLAALAPILQGVRISVQEALSGMVQNSDYSQRRLDRRLVCFRRMSRPMLISIRNTFRRKGRLALTLITLSLGGAIFIGTFNVQVSMKKYIEQVSQYFLADVNLVLSQPVRIDEIQTALSNVPGVSRVEGGAGGGGELPTGNGPAGESVQLLAPPAGSALVKPILIKGRWIEPGDQNAIALNERFLEDFPELEPGGNLHLRVDEKDTDWTIVGFFRLAGKSTGYIAYTDYVSLSRIIHRSGKAMSYRIVASQPNLTKKQQEQLGQRIEEHLNQKGFRVVDISTGSSLASNAAQGFSALTGYLLFLSSLTALVGSIGLAGTMSINVMERTREIGIMRAIGATNPILLKMVIVEGIIVGSISWILACLLAFPISRMLSDSISLSLFGSPSTFGMTPTGFIIWALVVFILSTLASILPAFNATRLTIREVLAYE